MSGHCWGFGVDTQLHSGLLSSFGTKYLVKVSMKKPKLTPWKIHSSGLELHTQANTCQLH